MQHDLDKLKYWLQKNGLILSIKTKYVLYGLKYERTFTKSIYYKLI